MIIYKRDYRKEEWVDICERFEVSPKTNEIEFDENDNWLNSIEQYLQEDEYPDDFEDYMYDSDE